MDSCVSSSRYEVDGGTYIRTVVSNGMECLHGRVSDLLAKEGPNFVGGHMGLNNFGLSIANANYWFPGGRLTPDQVEAELVPLAFGLLELAIQYEFELTSNEMDQNLSKLKNIIRKQTTANGLQANKSAILTGFLASTEIPSVIKQIDTQTKEIRGSIDTRVNDIETRLDELPEPPPTRTDETMVVFGTEHNPGPVLSQMTGRSSTPDLSTRARKVRQRLMNASFGAARDAGLEALAYADQEASKNPQLAEDLLQYARGQRFVANGQLPPELGQPKGAVRDYLTYRELNRTFLDKQALLTQSIATYPVGSSKRRLGEDARFLASDLEESATIELGQRNYAGAYELTGMAIQVLDVGLGFVPVVSAGKDLYELVIGANLVTGEQLDEVDRVLAATGLLSGGIVNSTTLRVLAKKAADLGRIPSRHVVGFLIEQGDVVIQQAVGLGMKSPGAVKNFFAQPIGRVWAKARWKLTHYDGIGWTELRRAPPKLENLPVNNEFGRLVPLKDIDAFMNGTGKLGPPKHDATWIVPWDDVKDHLTPDDLARRLWKTVDEGSEELLKLDPKKNAVVRFRLNGNFWNMISEATSVTTDRNNIAWVPGGQTRGGASEFLMGNFRLETYEQLGIIEPNSIRIQNLKSP